MAATADARRYTFLWRLHFWAGLLVAPIALWGALTGLVYAFSPQIEARLHRELDFVPVRPAPLPLDAQVAAALRAHPGAPLRFVVPAPTPGETTQVHLAAPPAAHAGHAAGTDHDHGLPSGTIVYVDPYEARVVGSLPELSRAKTFLKKLHQSFLQGERFRWVLELGASWLLVLLASGAYLFLPRDGRTLRQALVPRVSVGGRLAWRDLHTLSGLGLAAVLGILLVTGLTWSKFSGEVIKGMRDAAGQASRSIPKGLASGPAERLAGFEAIHRAALAVAPPIAMQITPPKDLRGVYRVENFDRSQPRGRFLLALDAGTGAVLFRSGWSDLPLFGKATAVGIPFHRGELGLWNQILVALAALGTLFSVVSGGVMWWKRKPKGSLGAPRRTAFTKVPWGFYPAGLACAVLMPLFGISLAIFVVADALIARRA